MNPPLRCGLAAAASLTCVALATTATAQQPPAAAPAAQPAPPSPAGSPPPPPPGYPPPPAAYPPGAYAPPPPGYYAAPPPPIGVHLHDGFYLRMDFGYGLLGVTETTDPSTIDVKVKGSGGSFALGLGGTPTPGLAIGGELLVQVASKPTVEAAGIELQSNSAVALSTFGPFVDWFPDPKGGGHVGAMIGWASFAGTNYSSSGYGAALFGGYDFWIGDQWSLGPLVRLTAAKTSKDPYTDSSTSLIFALDVIDH